MDKVLIVEDSKVFARLLIRKIEDELFFDTSWASNLEETKYILEENPEKAHFFAALLDLHLPDAPEGEVVDYVISKNIPVIVFTGIINNEIRDRLWSKKVVDYVLKETPDSLDYICGVVRRIYKNKFVRILVADDSSTVRNHLRRLLEAHEFGVLEADNGGKALELLEAHQDVKVVIADYYMPKVDGVELTRLIRRKYRREELSIIGISAYGESNLLSATFIKHGANDFLNKPFSSEEFYCRLVQNLEMLEYVQKLKETSIRDPLTGLYNRRYFFEAASKFYSNFKRGNLKITVAMLDIDFFKKVNDTYGHAAGDQVLRHVSEGISSRFRGSDIVARFGGEEFCVLAVNMDRSAAFEVFDDLRRSIERSKTKVDKQFIPATISIGVCDKPMDSLESMIAQADSMLYQAKRGGRNRVMICSA